MNSIDDEANLKLTKYSQKTLYTGYLTWGKNTCVRTWELKRGEGICSRGVYFWELMVIAFLAQGTILWNQLHVGYKLLCGNAKTQLAGKLRM